MRRLETLLEIVHRDSPSERGIDCAIIYDSNVFELVEPKFHHVDSGNTRDIVEAKLKHNGADLYVFMDHWPSRFHEDAYRNKAADVLRMAFSRSSGLLVKGCTICTRLSKSTICALSCLRMCFAKPMAAS